MPRTNEDSLREKAAEFANGNSDLEMVILLHLEFTSIFGRPKIEKPLVVGGVRFWRVGWNASHEFYLGIDDFGNIWRRSVGEGPWDHKANGPTLEEYNSRVQLPNIGYIGHT